MRKNFRIASAVLALGFCFSAAGCMFREEKIKKEEVPENSTWIFDGVYKCYPDNRDNELLARMAGAYPKIIADKYIEPTKDGQVLKSYIVCANGEVVLHQYIGASNQDENAPDYELVEVSLGTYDGKEITITGGAFSSNVEAYVSEGFFHIEDAMPSNGGNIEYGIVFYSSTMTAS